MTKFLILGNFKFSENGGTLSEKLSTVKLNFLNILYRTMRFPKDVWLNPVV